MLIKYINTKEDYCDVLEYFGIKKLKVLNFIAFCLSIVVAICIYVLLYKFDNIYRVIISLLISILICVFAIKKNKNYNLLNINNKWVLIDGNKSVVFIVPNNTFKSKNEEEIFINLIEKQI